MQYQYLLRKAPVGCWSLLVVYSDIIVNKKSKSHILKKNRRPIASSYAFPAIKSLFSKCSENMENVLF